MIDRIKRIPEVRFSNFSNEWQEKKLGDLGETYTGLSGKTKNDFGFGDSHFITYMNVFKNNIAKFEMTEKVKISNNEKQNKVNYGDIFFTTSSEVPQEVGMTSIWLFKTNNVYLNSFCFGFRITINNVLPIFLARYLRSENIRKKITILAQGSTRFNLSKKEVMKLSINFPEINEQQKIGDFFSKLDRQIELEEQKLEKLEEQKKGYMQQIFSQELRFKDENGNEYPEWEDKKLLNVIAIQNGYAFKSNLFSEKGMPIIRITDINKSTVKKGTVYYPESIEINERFKIKQYDILIAMSGATTGKVGKYISEKPSLLNQRIGKFVMKKGTDNNFMFTYLNSLYFKKELSKLLVAGAQPNISSQDIENINLFIPINEEQRKIGEFFNEIDELMEKQSSKIAVLKQRKKGFLQKMFV